MGKTKTQTLWTVEAFKALFKGDISYKKALIVLTKNMAVKRYEFLRIVLNLFNELSITTLIFDEFSGEITTQDLIKGSEVARDFDCDVIVGIGGAKTLDAAKLIAILSKESFGDHLFEALDSKQDIQALDMIAVPTTIHLKSAYSDVALFIDPIQEQIHAYQADTIMPKYALILPKVIESVPNDILTLHTLEMFYTATEVYILRNEHEVYVENIIRSVKKAFEGSFDSETIISILKASVQLTKIHHHTTPLEAFERAFLLLHPDIPYGAAQSLCILSYYQKLMKNPVYTERIGKLAGMLDIDVFGYDYSKQAEAFIESFKLILKKAQMSSLDLKNYGVDSAAISDYVHYTMMVLNNDLPMSEEDLYDLFEESLTI